MILDRFRLDGQVALVTGGTRGIGLAIARALGEAGAQIIISGRALHPETENVLGAASVKHEFIGADLEDPAAAERLVHEAARQAGRLDILINNAGIGSHGGSVGYAFEDWRRVMAVNVDSVFRASQAAIGHMLETDGGSIVNVGSISGIISNVPQQQAAYNSSKAAVHQMTKTLASEFADRNIRVNAIAPGYIDTDLTRGGLENPDWAPTWMQMTPMGRAGTSEEIATVALLLASPAGSYMTGSVVVVDGGYLTR